MTTRGQHRPAVRSNAANSQARERPQEAALRSCLAGTPVSGAYFHLPNHSWASVVTKVGDAVAPASCLLGKGSCRCIPVVPLEPWSSWVTHQPIPVASRDSHPSVLTASG